MGILNEKRCKTYDYKKLIFILLLIVLINKTINHVHFIKPNRFYSFRIRNI